MRINELIKMKRKEKNMTQQELADALYLSSKTISKWETGRGLPELAVIPSLSSALDIRPEELLTSINDTTSPNAKLKDLGLNNAIIISSSLFGVGVLSMLFSMTSIAFLVFAIILMVAGVVTYYVLENSRSIKIGFQRNDTINAYRRRAYRIWYFLFMIVPLAMVLSALFSPGVAVVAIFLPIVLFPTFLFVLAHFVFIKK